VKAHKSFAEATRESGLALKELTQRKQAMLESIHNWEMETAKGLGVLQRVIENDEVDEQLDYQMLCLGRNVVKGVHNAQGETELAEKVEPQKSIKKKTVAERAIEEFY
jgi:hypothetical protein